MGGPDVTVTQSGKLSFSCPCGHVVFTVKGQNDAKLDLEIDGEIAIRCPKCDKQTTMLGSVGQKGELKITV